VHQPTSAAPAVSGSTGLSRETSRHRVLVVRSNDGWLRVWVAMISINVIDKHDAFTHISVRTQRGRSIYILLLATTGRRPLPAGFSVL